MSALKILFFIYVTSLREICKAGDLAVQKIRNDLGGGDCIDSEDCSNLGICKILPKKNGTCCCISGYSGKHCEVNSKNPLGPILLASIKKDGLVKKLPAVGGKRTSVLSTDLKRKLEYEPSSNIYGLSPFALAEAEQPFVIYSPERKVYLFVSHDLRAVGKNDPYIEARNDKFGSRNFFKFVKVAGTANKYYIHNVERNKYLYVSQSSRGAIGNWDSNLLASPEIPSDEQAKGSFIFEFGDEDGDGLFMIRNKDKLLYVSDNIAGGNPASNLVKAADRVKLERLDSKYFQFALKDKVSNIEFKIVGGKMAVSPPLTLIDGAQSRKVCYKGLLGDERMQTTKVEFLEELIDQRKYTKAEGFLFNQENNVFKDSHGTEQFVHSPTETEIVTKNVARSAVINIKLNTCICVKVTFKNMQYSQPYEFQVKSKQNKILKSRGFVKGDKIYDFQVHTETFDYKQFFRCPNER